MLGGGTETLVHGTAIACGERAALIRGPSGSGKSDLALRCLFLPLQKPLKYAIELIADDQVQLTHQKESLYASAPGILKGRLEIRGLGIVDVPSKSTSRVCLLVQLSREDNRDRLPDPWPYETLLGCRLPVYEINPFETSAPHKLALALTFEPWLST